MTADRWERLERLYHAARERTPSERAGFLAEACGDNTALRRDLESLLSQDDGDGFLETRGQTADALTNLPSDGRFPGVALPGYEIQERIGVGGMGEVYRARDTTLGRDVAIKVLPRSVSDDPDRRARFEREARLLAALNHPHIAQIYGFQEFDGGRALVMELVEGESLDEMIDARTRTRRSEALPIAQAIGLARQIADALDAAHEKGIVHRDLKPSNIKVTRAGNVKVLDFGLAKAVDPAVATAAIATDVSRQPVILGTVPYMSPEQARGEPVDKRSDIWAFACVLFEMLVGRAPFEGDSASDTLFRILGRDPDWASLPADTPPTVRRLLERCLRKDRGRRLHDIADARIELDDVDRPAGVQPRPATSRRERLAWMLSLLLVLGVSLSVMVLLYRRGAALAEEQLEWTIGPPPPAQESLTTHIDDFAISPDGRQVVAVALAGSTPSVWVRAVAGLPWRQLTGTEGAISAFWKPDSQSIGFFADGAKGRQLKTVSLNVGRVNVVCDLPGNRPPYGAWGRGFILFSSDVVLRKVAEDGGNSVPWTKQLEQREVHRSPSFLPDADHFLYLAQTVTKDGTTNALRVGSLSSDQTTSLGPFGSNAVYASGFLLFVRDDGRLTAQPFDPDSRRVTGDPQPLAEDVELVRPWRRGQFSVSTTGRLMYRQAGKVVSQLTWFDRKGQTRETTGEPGEYSNLNLNRDNTQLLVTRVTKLAEEPSNIDIWRFDLARSAAATRLTFDRTAEYDPAWSPNGRQIVFGSVDQDTIIGKTVKLVRRSADGTGDNQVLLTDVEPGQPELGAPEWSPDGRFLLFTRNNTEQKRRELWMIEPSGDRTRKRFLDTPRNAANGAFSPSGRWVAYETDDSGKYEIFVSPFPQADGRIQISTNGGRAPRWSGDGKELFFLALNGSMMAAHIDPATGRPRGVPQALFPTEIFRHGFAMHPYVVTSDGQRFLMPVFLNQPDSSAVSVLQNWPAKLHK